ncbi:MAG TPA: sulfurtransferase [Candidatus Limnocylindrales bacterium]
MNALVRPEILASADWLADQIGRPEIRVLDVRWRPDGSGRGAWQAGHIPGATHLDWAAELCERDESTEALLLAGPDKIAAALGHAGVGDGTTAVIYDDTLGLYAARAWWSLRVYGHDSARILDGGYAAWTEGGLSRAISRAEGTPSDATFTPRAQPRMRLTTADVRSLLGSPDVLLLDARAPAEYRGHEGNARRLGHIPGATNVPVAAMTRPGSQSLRDGVELREILHRANVSRGRRLVCYDGSGVAAAKLAFVLALLGHDDVAVYDGGWAEWGDRLDLPVER